MKFLVIGEKMTDRYYVGSVRRLNPEKHAAPLLDCSRVAERPGGAWNVATNLLAMGAEVEFVWQRAGNIVKNRLWDVESGTIARFDCEDECRSINPLEIQEKSHGCCAVIVSDYGKGAIDIDVADAVRSLGLLTFVDAKVRPDRWVDFAEAVFPNKSEYLKHKDDYSQSQLCIVKLGHLGADLYVGGVRSTHQFQATNKHPANVAGAGDTVLASYAACYMAMGLEPYPLEFKETFPLEIAMDFAGKAVEDPFTAAPSFVDVYGPLLNVSPDLKKIIERLKMP